MRSGLMAFRPPRYPGGYNRIRIPLTRSRNGGITLSPPGAGRGMGRGAVTGYSETQLD